MAVNLAVIVIIGLLISLIFNKIKLPGLLGMLIIGVIIGPSGLNIVGEEIINISSDLRRIALIIILLRAGLGINKETLKEIGALAIKMSIIPGLIEGTFIIWASMRFLNFTFVQGGMLGFIIAAVSPAIVVPYMINLIEKDVGTKKGIPTLLLASTSIDDVVAITVFTAFLGLYTYDNLNIALVLLSIPTSIMLGVIIGGFLGLILVWTFKRYLIIDTKKVLIILSLGIVLNEIETMLWGKLNIAPLIGVMTMTVVIADKLSDLGKRLSNSFSEIWIFSEILLFVLVGINVNVDVALKAGSIGVKIILIGLCGRSIGVIVSLIGTDYNWREILFCIVSYIPKATVQAAMGAVPLSLGVRQGEIIFAISVLSIVITAPLGAIGIYYMSDKLEIEY